MDNSQPIIRRVVVYVEYADGKRWEVELVHDETHYERINLEIFPGEFPMPDVYMPHYVFENRTTPPLHIEVRGLPGEVREGDAVRHARPSG
jgi:hypothetical protein